jgi:protein-S-isoprenylcysteine O-methyltransferase Ste14
MTIFNQLITIFWLIFLVYWLISARGVKRDVHGRSWWYGAIFRITVIIIVFLLFRAQIPEHLFRPIQNYVAFSVNPVINGIGVALCAIGLALAIWARVHLGKNWGMPMSLKVEPELVTTGPYAFVRHPIYSGVLLAMLGSALVSVMIWLILFPVFCAYFLYSARAEERIMATKFPNQYRQYRNRTKMLIPFVF